MQQELITAIRAFCQSDATLKIAVGGNRGDTNTPYVGWNIETYNYPYATINPISGIIQRVFGQRTSDALYSVRWQFSFFGDGSSKAGYEGQDEAAAVERLCDLLDQNTLTLVGTSNLMVDCTQAMPPIVTQFLPRDRKTGSSSKVWVAHVDFDFTIQGTVGSTA